MKNYIFGIVANPDVWNHTSQIRAAYSKVGTVMNLEDKPFESLEDGVFGLSVKGMENVRALEEITSAARDHVGSVGYEHWGTFAENHKSLPAREFIRSVFP